MHQEKYARQLSTGLAYPFVKSLIFRSLICILAVGLLWSTSLSVARHICQQTVVLPPFSLVRDECVRTYNEVRQQQRQHISCAKRQLRQCDHALGASATKELLRTQRQRAANEHVLDRSEELAQSCADLRLSVLDRMDEMQRVGVRLVWDDESCNAEQISEVQSLVGGSGKERDRALGLASQFVHTTNAQQSEVLRAIRMRHEYDVHYIQQKTLALQQLPEDVSAISLQQQRRINASLQALVASMQACGGKSCRLPFEDTLGEMREKYCRLPFEDTFGEMREKYQLLHESLEQQHRRMVVYQQAVESTVAGMRSQLVDAYTLIDSLPHVGSFQMVDIPTPLLTLPTVKVAPLPSTAAIRAQFIEYQRDRQFQIEKYVQEVSNSQITWASRIGLSSQGVPKVLADYDPPDALANASIAQREVMANSESFLLRQREAIHDLTGSLRSRNVSLSRWNGSSWNASFSRIASWNEALQRHTGSFEPFHGIDLKTFNLFDVTLGKIGDLAVTVDFVFRVFMSIRLWVKYWGRASTGLPPIDIRSNMVRASGVLGAMSAWCNPKRLISSLLLSPLTLGSVALGGLLLLLQATAALYIPLFVGYVHGCVEPPQNGSIISRNLFSTSYNFAATDGDKLLAAGLAKHSAVRSGNCSENFRASAKAEQQLQQKLLLTSQAHQAVARDLSLLRSCLRLDTMAAASNSSTIYSIDGLRLEMQDGARCAVRLNTSIHTAVYDCQALPQCEHTCDGPSRPLLSSLCQTCGCHAEWLFHGLLLNLLLSLLVFALLNVSRILFMDALCRFCWRQLMGGQLEFVANCNEFGRTAMQICLHDKANGNAIATLVVEPSTSIAEIKRQMLAKEGILPDNQHLIFDGKPLNDGHNVQTSALRQAIKLALRADKCRAILFIMMAILINIPWMFARDYVSEHLKFSLALDHETGAELLKPDFYQRFRLGLNLFFRSFGEFVLACYAFAHLRVQEWLTLAY
eukprot:CAMPEP_0119344384 /NCGR_PEP_ID=MMETSP1333-20130426/106945_1 /TAXON_ID=418940 /ORGANISM="Scyphosphaera apsteinii, Strain RCC1455" /LENGTH=975 /DNA_ID=CAMNT_0007356823 /DNA_START=14 /DNA_END=2942 /DNA_ORIENTATION=-